MNLKEWESKGNYIEVNGHAIFYIAHKSNKPTICILHGYPSCSYDYNKVISFLQDDFSIYIHDQLGFGLSAKPNNYSYSLIEQAETAIQFWSKLGLKEIHLVSHDYGTTVANEIIYRKLNNYEPVKINTVTFCNGSMHIEMAKLKLIQKILKHPYFGKFVARLMNKPLFIKNMKDIWYDKSRFYVDEVSLLYDMLMYQSCSDVVHKISQYNNEREKFWHRWIGCLPQLDVPTQVLWAQQDPIAVKEIAEQLVAEIPNAHYYKIENCGHYPMLEAPEIWSNYIKSFINKYI